MLSSINKKTVVIGVVLGVLIALYAIAGFVVAPRLVRSAVLEDIPKALGLTPSVGDIGINPFLLKIAVADFSLAGKDGQKLLGFDRLTLDLELSSLWHRAYTFADIELVAPYVSAVVDRDGSLNLAQLQPKTAQPASRSPLPAIRIDSFKVSRGSLAYADHSRPDVFALRLEPITFDLRDFTTGSEGGLFTFAAASKQGERLEWHGHLALQPLESDGEFRVDGLRAHTLWEYLQDRVNFVLDSGHLDIAATYKLYAGAAAAAPLGTVTLSRVALTDLKVRSKDVAAPWVTLPALTVTGTVVDLGQRRARVESIDLAGLKVTAWREADGAINLQKLVAPVPASSTAATGSTSGVQAPTLTASGTGTAAPPAWRFDLGHLDLHDASVSIEDRAMKPAVKMTLAPFAVHLTQMSQDLDKPVELTLDTHLNGGGTLAVGGSIVPQPLAADLSVKLADLDLTVLQPYIAQHSSLTLRGGRLGGGLTVHYATAKNRPVVRVAGDMSLAQLHTVDDALHDDFVNWDGMDVLGINYRQNPDALDIAQIVMRKPYAKVIIEADSSTNLKRVLAVPGAPTPAPARTPVAAAPPAAPVSSGSMPLSIEKIVVQDGDANFADRSVTPNFATGIHHLTGTIVGLSSAPNSRATVDLHGSVEAFSPVSIVGEVNVLGPRLYTDIGLSFQNISLAILNPYSDKFAGYNITEGKLSTQFQYKVNGRTLDAQHHIVIEQLEFGDKTASKDAISLPIKLAISLLKDRNGVIDLNLPVTGSLDDPQFRLGGVIWKVFVNILERAVTAPFALLGSMFGGGPEMQLIDFKPGVSTVSPEGILKLKSVATALVERPQLKIEVPIAVVPDVDRPALVEAQFEAQLRAVESTPVAFDTLDAPARLAVLLQAYTRQTGSTPRYPDAVISIQSKPDAVGAKIDFLSRALRASIHVSDSDLTALGQQRALALQAALLTDTQVTAERVFLVANDKATAKDGSVRLELTLR